MPTKNLALIALFMVAAPLPAFAADTSCATRLMTPEFRVDLAKAMTVGDNSQSDSLFDKLSAMVDTCAQAAGYNQQQGAAYFDLVMSEVTRGWLIAELEKVGLTHSVIDEAFDFGAGRANPSLGGNISEGQIEAVIGGFLVAGVDVDKVSEQTWEQVGAYAAATSLYWQAFSKLP